MRPEAVVSAGDAEPGEEVVNDRPDEGWSIQRSVWDGEEAVRRDNYDHRGVEPVDMLIPISDCDGLGADVLFRCRSRLGWP